LAGVEGASDIIPRRRRDHPSIISIKTFQRKSVLWLWKAVANPAVEAAGFWLGNLHEKATIKAGSTLA
jgi:hypothetical protein